MTYVIWACPKCGWQPPHVTMAYTGECAAGHEKVPLVAYPAVIVATTRT